MDFKSIDKVVTLEVKDKEVTRTILFKPNITKKMIPQYVLVKGDVFEKRLKNRV
jgi:hypothetical protein